jgi:hypothetical protein
MDRSPSNRFSLLIYVSLINCLADGGEEGGAFHRFGADLEMELFFLSTANDLIRVRMNLWVAQDDASLIDPFSVPFPRVPDVSKAPRM